MNQERKNTPAADWSNTAYGKLLREREDVKVITVEVIEQEPQPDTIEVTVKRPGTPESR